MIPAIIVIGSSGHAKVILDAVEAEGRYRVEGLIDSVNPDGPGVLGYPVLGAEARLPGLLTDRQVEGCVVAIGDNWTRDLVSTRLAAVAPSLRFVTVVHPKAHVGRGSVVGDGSVVLAGAVINPGSTVGRGCILNTNSSLDHDSWMGDFSSLAPNATTGGNVRIGDHAAVALGASVLEGRTVGRHTVIGAGAVVIDDVADFCIAYGVPARVVRTRREGESYL